MGSPLFLFQIATNTPMDLTNLARRFSRSDETPTSPPPFVRPASIDTAPVPFGHNTGDHEELRRARRTRSKSECLLLAKNHSKSDLPTPCQDYISQIQLIMAKNETSRSRNSSTGSATSPVGSKSTPPTPVGPDAAFMHLRRSNSARTNAIPATE
ncbi:hypothetical protein SPRG_02358 [Saprolegnia parasitica CBS 223.65]|uniref:Uncharacterized protein n=1 Tax=Saprolegnia parasitica (strain CBS 223.65) TaxID=695850 RepID=A0A067D0V8_SAPPC|nr:hypothetical protein SPRG_02358 [Saprolegnia parasitica CBS 223.65]KDO32657.1 hypothetical protein SPRG_02358 [Saprolegnia parasitica CBS 223.65]|eukprot:XP_012196324.1 hypothetical protein SPRG_02358 [Saprolegnia parasitica CBS 223.65]